MVSFIAALLTSIVISVPLHASALPSHGPGAIHRRAGASVYAAHAHHALTKREGDTKGRHCGDHKALVSSGSTSSGNTYSGSSNGGGAVTGNIETSTRAVTTTVAVATTTASGAAVSSTPTTAVSGASGGMDATQVAEFLQLHNAIRAQHGAAPLTWSNKLATAGEGWADKCVFDHSNHTLGPYGENLAAGTGSGYDVPQAMKTWTDEESEYNAANPKYSHYTQIVWKATQQVGCGLASCNGIFDASFGPAKYFVCEYYPAGNIEGEFGTNVQ